MDRKIQIFIEGQRIELFNDETISVNSSIQNVSDLSAVFTDFSQSFTVPASPINNAIFQHFYQNDVDATLDYNLRRDAYIEIDYSFFRRGKIQLEKSEVKNNMAYSYTITFYGDARAFKDILGEDMLSDLDYTSLAHPYTGAEIQARIETNANYDVCYPLISNKNVWSYNGGAWDITQNNHAIEFTELFPAVRIKSILDLIQTQYGVTFLGTFINSQRFKNAYMLYKNKNEFLYTTEGVGVDITSVVQSPPPNYDAGLQFSIPNDSLTIVEKGGDVVAHQIEMNITGVSNPTAIHYLDVYINGNLATTYQGTGAMVHIVDYIFDQPGLNIVYTFKFRSNMAMTINAQINYKIWYTFGGSTLFTGAVGYLAPTTTSANLNLTFCAPQMKLVDFIRGLTQQFNMTCYSTEQNVYYLEPIDDWYAKGAVIDITKYVVKESIEYSRMKLYKKISMGYQQSESFMNKAFLQNALHEYGDTTYQYPYDGDEYSIELPFENLLFNKFTGTDLQVAYCLNEGYSQYVPKPVILYKNGLQSGAFKFWDGFNHVQINNYQLFGQEWDSGSQIYSLNFNAEISSFYEQVIQSTLFATYYFGYLVNLYNLKSRMVNLKAIFPISLITGLKLNDRLIVRDKRYLINNMKTNLTTSEVELELINDFRPVVNNTYLPNNPNTGLINVGVSMPNGAVSGMATTSNPNVVINLAPIQAQLLTQGGATMVSQSGLILVADVAQAPTADGVYFEQDTFLLVQSPTDRNAISQFDVTFQMANGDTQVITYTITNQ